MSAVSLLDSRNRWGSWHRGANPHPLASLHNLMVKISIYVFEAVALNGSFLHTQGILFHLLPAENPTSREQDFSSFSVMKTHVWYQVGLLSCMGCFWAISALLHLVQFKQLSECFRITS